MIGRAISHYRVLSALGSGGMGVVYLAEDERLGRQVALKFLPPESVSSRQALDRFRVEARAASSLSHPGICAVYDIGEDGGAPYIVMEALKGESLRDRINRGPMKIVDLLDVGIQLADALDAAHSQGIIHRDIKPSNIFVGDKNRAKILDFGLAKLAPAAAARSNATTERHLDAATQFELTIPGSALGTVSYMSPEQARGEDVDTRTDLFSLGVVLYEMATGVQAFGGSTQAVIFDAILNRAPPPITHINQMVPPRLEALIATALEKDRDLRQQHASDFEAELKRARRDLESGLLVASAATWAVAPTAAIERPPASAVLPPAPSPKQRVTWRHGVAALAVSALGFYVWYSTSRVVAPPASDTASHAAPVIDPPPAATQVVPGPAALPVTPAARPQDTVAAPARPEAQPPQPTRPGPPEVRTPASQAATTTAPRRTLSDAAPPNVTPAPAPSATPVVLTPPQTSDSAAANAPAPAAPAPAPPTPQPAPRNTSVAPAPAAVTASSPVESDDAAIRGVIRTYGRAIETKSVELFRSVRPGLSSVEEARLRDSFRQVDAHQVAITVNELRIDGRRATVQLSRLDTFVTGGRRQTQSSRQTLQLEEAAAGWIITGIGQ